MSDDEEDPFKSPFVATYSVANVRPSKYSAVAEEKSGFEQEKKNQHPSINIYYEPNENLKYRKPEEDDPFAGLWNGATSNILGHGNDQYQNTDHVYSEKQTTSDKHEYMKIKEDGFSSNTSIVSIQQKASLNENLVNVSATEESQNESKFDDSINELLVFLGSANSSVTSNNENNKKIEPNETSVSKKTASQINKITDSSSKFDFFDSPSYSISKTPLFTDDDFEPVKCHVIDADPLNTFLINNSTTDSNIDPSKSLKTEVSASAPKLKSRGTIDLEESRRRTSLLNSSASVRKIQDQKSINSLQRDSESMNSVPSHTFNDVDIPPIGAPDTGGNYFNEALLRQRQNIAPGTAIYNVETYEGETSSGWDAGGIFGKAETMVNAAKSGARTLLQKANGYASNSSSTSNLGKMPKSEYDVVFGEGRLGFTLLKASDGTGIVCRIQPGSTASKMGVAEGDAVVAVNKQRLLLYDEIMSFLPHVSRPVLVSFSKSTVIPSHNSQAQKTDDWRVISQDLQIRRPDFHGVVVHAFGGIFSWSLYGTSDGSEAPGSRMTTSDTYTEYVMRCQWGVNPQNMSPWMVARRYREFDALDKDLKEIFPHLKDSFPTLPPKELFKTSAEVVARRRIGLEQYMTFLIGNCPDVLCCGQMDKFLGISERIRAIKMGQTQKIMNSSLFEEYKLPSVGFSSEEAFAAVGSGGSSVVDPERLMKIMTAEEAYDIMRAQSNSLKPLGKSGLSVVEESVKRLDEKITEWNNGGKITNLLLDAELQGLTETCQQAWPTLKATALCTEDSPEGLEILPRVIQCDEALERVLNALSILCRKYSTP